MWDNLHKFCQFFWWFSVALDTCDLSFLRPQKTWKLKLFMELVSMQNRVYWEGWLEQPWGNLRHLTVHFCAHKNIYFLLLSAPWQKPATIWQKEPEKFQDHFNWASRAGCSDWPDTFSSQVDRQPTEWINGASQRKAVRPLLSTCLGLSLALSKWSAASTQNRSRRQTFFLY